MTSKYLPRLILGFSMIIAVAACRKVKYQKDALAYYPKVHTERVQVQPDGSVEVTGVITEPGSGAISLAGFCLDTVPDPDILVNQQLAEELQDNRFTTVYKNLDARKTYYVSGFAANEFGYTKGASIRVERPGMDTNNIPCHPGTDQIIVESSSSARSDKITSVSKVDPFQHTLECSGYNTSFWLRFEFGRTPTTGKYTIWSHVTRNSNTVSVLFSDPNRGSYYMSDGGELYVQSIDDTRIRVWICNQKSGEGRFITACFNSD